MADIHPTAIVHPGAELAETAVIGAYTIVQDDVIVGEGSKIETGAFLDSGTRLGKNCSVGHHAILGNPPQDLKYRGEKTTLEVGDGTVIREFATLNRGTTYHHRTVIGKNCFIMTYVHVAHDCIIGDHVILANAVNMAGHVEIGSHSTIGGMTPIHQFVKVGEHAFVGGGLRINKDVPPYIRAMGEPVRYGGTNYIGLSRKGFSKETILEIKRAYRLIYQSDYTMAEAVQAINEQLQPLPEIKKIVQFVENSDRGLIRG